MNISEIETFLMIVKTRNISKTAENLFLSQPTVSHRLKSLEDELDVKLITRKKGYKQIELTAQGEEFIPIAERWVSIWREMQGTSSSPASLAARSRRSPATSSQPSARRRTVRGWSSPRAWMEPASSSSSWVPKTRRG